MGSWSANLSQSYKTGYTDQTQSAVHSKVAAYTLVNLSGSYTGFDGLALTLGMKNLFDKEPPFSNQGTLFQKGYDARYTDPTGRAIYARASYAF
jgi:iron complex outermembrane receptor protein